MTREDALQKGRSHNPADELAPLGAPPPSPRPLNLKAPSNGNKAEGALTTTPTSHLQKQQLPRITVASLLCDSETPAIQWNQQMTHPQCPAAQGYHIGQGTLPGYSATYGLPQTGAAMQGQQRQPVQHPAPGAVTGQSSAQRPPYQPPHPQAAPPGTQAPAPTPMHPPEYTQSTKLQAPHDASPAGLYNSLSAAKPPTPLPTATSPSGAHNGAPAVVATADMARILSMTSKTRAAGSYVSTTPYNLGLGPSQGENLQNASVGSQGESMAPTTCTNCFTQTTILWRRGPKGQYLCNACEFENRIGDHPPAAAPHRVARPLRLKTDVIWKTNRGSMSVGGLSTRLRR
ncbi:hypothetical protein GGTG_13545 [Gaeumannomyces tritici R3-111a-1]|uniref:GATA-type domain-containing protein n=1 Tax=Gaeumannomyces tritici (strain R3-111a-1) TaxID=644352 RepID=J3PJ63_GAET3|nr:hypothetical protein GGTG_13545 [Gaeumannomyces tritici R3-111a-1]EJT68881.1 hypothetical protein GGTG_13545 [Gaeumannomyces tritici R3-111a-1]